MNPKWKFWTEIKFSQLINLKNKLIGSINRSFTLNLYEHAWQVGGPTYHKLHFQYSVNLSNAFGLDAHTHTHTKLKKSVLMYFFFDVSESCLDKCA